MPDHFEEFYLCLDIDLSRAAHNLLDIILFSHTCNTLIQVIVN